MSKLTVQEHLSALAKRVDELEMRGAFLDDGQTELSDVLASESKRIKELQLKINRLERQLKSLAGTSDPATDEPPPPHY